MEKTIAEICGNSRSTSHATLGVDKVSILTHTYPHKLPRKIRVTICNHQADNQLYVWPDV